MLNIEQIKEILPHRYPFLLLDRVDELAAGERCVATKCVTAGEQFFCGHFPAKAVMPGVLIIEALAQAGAVAVLSLPQHKGKTAYFAAIKEARFKRQVVPGDVLTLEMEIVKIRSTSGIGKGVATVGNEVACEAEIMFMFSSDA
ncbi:MAG: 3-hydroxyacyl-ACP dehydratase FabZ [Clostridiales bacterium]|jgi:3-hydroxyacyl-[acyl-carrier-protein] dehydratase|nr:3-hydroxyacyl-ACP dehydratase FabZ [Clostridiales bacterium]